MHRVDCLDVGKGPEATMHGAASNEAPVVYNAGLMGPLFYFYKVMDFIDDGILCFRDYIPMTLPSFFFFLIYIII
jgi:hypothetical protein